ncbi:hypothetical protein ACFSTC_30450 [Nonomuraea ferruginea]
MPSISSSGADTMVISPAACISSSRSRTRGPTGRRPGGSPNPSRTASATSDRRNGPSKASTTERTTTGVTSRSASACASCQLICSRRRPVPAQEVQGRVRPGAGSSSAEPRQTEHWWCSAACTSAAIRPPSWAPQSQP